MMKKVSIMMLLLLPVLLMAQPLVFTHAAVVDNQVGFLSWRSHPSDTVYRLHRMFPDQDDYTCIATLSDTFYYDTLHRTICADTVNYYVVAAADTSLSVGLFYQDNVPTAPCSLQVCNVENTLGHICLSWYPSPDTDIMGYYICMGDPCLYYDTVWGRLNTSYICREQLDQYNNDVYSFRILAFDSCFQASPLTPYYHNLRLEVKAEPCSRLLQCSWNRYINMPDSVGSYRLYYRLQGDDRWCKHIVGPEGPFTFDTLIPDLAIGHLSVYVVAVNTTDSLSAFSLVHDFSFDDLDTAEYLRITDIQYDENTPSATLTFEIDPYFQGRTCYVYRATGLSNNFERIAELTRSATQPEQFLTYTDLAISRAAGCYVYRIGVPDICEQWIKFSDTAQLLLPDVSQPEAYFPNAIRYGDPDNGRFCPHYLSALAQGYSLDIYNRFGTHLFHTDNLYDCWDGNDIQGRPLPQGVYVYHAHCRYADGSEKLYLGTILLLH